MNFFRHFHRVILRHFRFEWGKLILSVFGVAIGVAVFVAIRLANTTAYEAFNSTLNAVSGRANLQVLSSDGLGFDERLIKTFRQSKAVEAAAPVIEQYAQLQDSTGNANNGTGAPLLIFGVDVFAESAFRDYSFDSNQEASTDRLRFLLEPDAAIITTTLAAKLHLERGDSLRLIANGKRVALNVIDIIEAEGTASALDGSFVLLDIAAAQEVFDRIGKLDRIDLLVPEEQRKEIREYLTTQLPGGVLLQEPESRGEQTTKMLDAFDLNLSALSFIALFVAMFIIYNTMLTNTLRRRRELGILRAVGATRKRIMLFFLAEAALIGVLGAAIGLPAGIALADLAVEQVTRTVTTLYIVAATEQVAIDPLTLIIGGTLGILASIASALPPAIEASRAHPRETFSIQTLEAKVTLSYPRILLSSAIALIGALLIAWLGQQLMNPLLGFGSAALVLIGFALLTPAVLKLSGALLSRLVKKIFGVEGELAGAYLLQSLGRSSTAIAALMTAIAMLIGISTMVGSFRNTVDYWLRQTITADLYVQPAINRLSAATPARIPDEVIDYLKNNRDIRYVDELRRTRLQYSGRTIEIGGGEFPLSEEEATVSFLSGTWNEAQNALDTGAVLVNESFAIRFNKDRGDSVVLSTPSGMQPFSIAGIYYDYSSDAGAILMKKDHFAKTFRDSSTTHIALYLNTPETASAVIDDIGSKFAAKYSLLTYSNRALRESALEVFDQTFSITYALQIVAIIVAAIGVANTLAALVVERRREIGILKAIGATGRQIRKMTLVQAGLIALASQILGIIAGLLLSAILIYVINRVSFGWTIQLQISGEIIAVSALLVLVTAIIAGLGPANAAARKQIAAVIKAE